MMIHTKTETSEKHICTCPRLSAIEKERRRGEKFPILPELCLRRLNIQKRLTIHAWTNLQSGKNSMMIQWFRTLKSWCWWCRTGRWGCWWCASWPGSCWGLIWSVRSVWSSASVKTTFQRFNCKTFATLWILWTQIYPSSQGGVYLSLEKQMGVEAFGLER